jgi:lipoprotein-anchoring transpeptidase ErfK/SrfK
MTPGPISRRDFIKLGGVGLLGLYLPHLPLDPVFTELAPGQQGRVADPTLTVYDIPSFEGGRVTTYWRDIVLPITGIGFNDDAKAYNRVWYQVSSEGYAYSGAIQPVRTVINEPASEIPPEGALAEVTVPYTDALREPRPDARLAYRLYYETTHWVVAVSSDDQGTAWYRLYDDKFRSYYHVPARHLRLIPEAELAPISAEVPAYQKMLEVRLSQQLVVAYERGKIVFASRASTGARFSNGTYRTPLGRYITNYKRPSRHMAAGDIASNGYDLPGVPWVCYITKSGIAFHGTYWHNDFGRPRSHGCINLTPAAARWVYLWTQPVVPPKNQLVYKEYGTGVTIVE